jgi:hypothetical protein
MWREALSLLGFEKPLEIPVAVSGKFKKKLFLMAAPGKIIDVGHPPFQCSIS